MQFEHLNLSVSDIERSITFYRALLGGELRWRGLTKDGRPAAHVGGADSYLAMFEAVAQPTRRDDDSLRVGFNHFGFQVADLDAAARRVAELGVRPHHESHDAPGRRLYLRDPDGFEVELVEYASRDEALSVPGAAS
ncbi:MAG: hypothetical protein DHS20C15_25830 [Planctomycetota bacterium]|nr:MAG: hypothetical protein DHS20C15_25830 [Planctomycetota bacterium]